MMEQEEAIGPRECQALVVVLGVPMKNPHVGRAADAEHSLA